MDNDWYIAELIEEFRVEKQTTSLVHVNWVLIRAVDDEGAYKKALELGRKLNNQYHNTEGELVRVTFRGLRNLNKIHEDLEDGAEITYELYEDINSKAVEKMIVDKQQLAIFRKTD